MAFGEALRPEFKLYARPVVENARALADTIASGGYESSRAARTTPSCWSTSAPAKGLTGKAAEAALVARPHHR